MSTQGDAGYESAAPEGLTAELNRAIRTALEASHCQGLAAGVNIRLLLDPRATSDDLAVSQDSRDAAQVRGEMATREVWRLFYEVAEALDGTRGPQ